MKLKIIFIVIIFLFLQSIASANDQKIVTVRLSDYKPHYFQNENGEWAGIEYDMVKKIIETAGYQMKPVFYNWSRGLASLEAGKLDIMLCMAMTPERHKFVYFLGISTHEQTVLVVKKENKNIPMTTMDDFVKKGSVFGIRQNFFYSKEFNEKLKNDDNFASRFISLATSQLTPRMISANRITGAFGDKISLSYNLLNNPEYSDFSIVVLPFFKPIPVYFGLSKNADPKKLRDLQMAYDYLKASGQLQSILEKWVGIAEY
ncbi:MAG: transporter substrate-binding domain-containing protein [Desulfobacula sp.]|nr:transporter substrate-binding domain-containing protein [Desulfobacula sp.]